MNSPLIDASLVRLDVDLGRDKHDVIRALAEMVAGAGRSDDPAGLTDDALAREATAATGLPGGIAIPHCRTEHVDVPTLAFARLSPKVDFGAKDGPADLAFLIAAPAGGDATHLQLLTKLARALVRKDFTDGLRNASSDDEVLALVHGVVGGPSPTAASAPPAQSGAASAAGATAASAESSTATSTAPSSAAGSGASSELIDASLVRLDVDLGRDKEQVIRALSGIVGEAGRSTDAGGLATDTIAREGTAATGLPGGIAIPHCRTEHVDVPTLAFARLSPKVDFGAKDGPADLAFLIAAPAGGDATHLQLLTKLARALVKKDFTEGLRNASSADEVVGLVSGVVGTPQTAAASPAAAPARTPSQPPTEARGATPAAAPASAGSASAGSAPSSTPAPASTPAATATESPATSGGGGRRSLVAITACPTGIAHTYMAAEALEAAAERAGVDMSVETQGSAGSTPLGADTIAKAAAVIFATDVGVKDRPRFAGKPVIASGVKRAIDDSDGMIRDALAAADNPNATRVEGTAAAGAAQGSAQGGGEHLGLKIRRVLMTGVSYMIPFVAAGGLMIALGFLLGGYQIALPSTFDGAPVSTATHILQNSNIFDLPDPSAYQLAGTALPHGALLTFLGALCFAIGAGAFSFLVPALAGYIAYGIADRPGIAPGFVMGWVAVNILNSGFLGGIIGGLLAGVVAHWFAHRKTAPWLRGLMPVVVIPLATTLVCGFIMVVVLGQPLNKLMAALNDGLTNLSNGASAVLLGVVLGLMMAFDMGGPLNKTAYLFATAGLGAAATATGDAPQLKIMAAVMIAGMVPPLGLALATVLRPHLFTEPERENGKAAWLLGASFITEGAIPFAAADPLRVVPAIMAGSAVAGGLSMALDVSLRAPHGGIFVLFAVGHTFGFFIALIAGTVVAAALVIVLKQFTESEEEIEELATAAV